jgi:hypothetical protein
MSCPIMDMMSCPSCGLYINTRIEKMDEVINQSTSTFLSSKTNSSTNSTAKAGIKLSLSWAQSELKLGSCCGEAQDLRFLR